MQTYAVHEPSPAAIAIEPQRLAAARRGRRNSRGRLRCRPTIRFRCARVRTAASVPPMRVRLSSGCGSGRSQSGRTADASENRRSSRPLPAAASLALSRLARSGGDRHEARARAPRPRPGARAGARSSCAPASLSLSAPGKKLAFLCSAAAQFHRRRGGSPRPGRATARATAARAARS